MFYETFKRRVKKYGPANATRSLSDTDACHDPRDTHSLYDPAAFQLFVQ